MSFNSRILFDVQSDVAARLASESYFSIHSVKSLRKLQTASTERDRLLPHLTAAGGKVGCGILVGFPTLDGTDFNASGPQGEILLPVDVMEAPEINFGNIGTQRTAEEVAFAVRYHLHQFGIEGIGSFYQDKSAIESVPENFLPARGMVGFRVLLRAHLPQSSPAKCVLPTLAEASLTVTISGGTAGASIYYTTDNSFPGSGNSVATLYSAPFVVTSGTVVRWAAYKSDFIGSDAAKATIT